jgi:hypothetical protein
MSKVIAAFLAALLLCAVGSADRWYSKTACPQNIGRGESLVRQFMSPLTYSGTNQAACPTVSMPLFAPSFCSSWARNAAT